MGAEMRQIKWKNDQIASAFKMLGKNQQNNEEMIKALREQVRDLEKQVN